MSDLQLEVILHTSEPCPAQLTKCVCEAVAAGAGTRPPNWRASSCTYAASTSLTPSSPTSWAA
eukprot:2595603-Pyramimonas_sp.AAC.1